MLKVNWKSTNLWFNIFMFVGGFWAVTTDTANAVISTAVAGIGAFGLVRQFISTAKFGGVLQTLRQGNTITYLTNALVLFGIPKAAEIIPALSAALEGILSQNWGAVFASLFTLVNILIYILKNRGGAKEAA